MKFFSVITFKELEFLHSFDKSVHHNLYWVQYYSIQNLCKLVVREYFVVLLMCKPNILVLNKTTSTLMFCVERSFQSERLTIHEIMSCYCRLNTQDLIV